jgi:hypothetical protein
MTVCVAANGESGYTAAMITHEAPGGLFGDRPSFVDSSIGTNLPHTEINTRSSASGEVAGHERPSPAQAVIGAQP